MTKKPYYKLTVGEKPYTSADLRFDVGRVRIEVSDEHPECAKLVADLCDVRWGAVCRKVLAFFDASESSLADTRAGRSVTLTEPADRPLRDEVARLDARRADAHR